EVCRGKRENRWARAYAALRWSPPDRLLPADTPEHWANFRAIRREAFIAVGGYDDVGYGEDMTLAPKLGEDAVAAEGAVCFHHHPATARQVFENGRWGGRAGIGSAAGRGGWRAFARGWGAPCGRYVRGGRRGCFRPESCTTSASGSASPNRRSRPRGTGSNGRPAASSYAAVRHSD